MQNYIDSCHKESEICTAYQEHSTAHFNIVANVNADSECMTPQKKNMGGRKIVRNIVIPL